MRDRFSPARLCCPDETEFPKDPCETCSECVNNETTDRFLVRIDGMADANGCNNCELFNGIYVLDLTQASCLYELNIGTNQYCGEAVALPQTMQLQFGVAGSATRILVNYQRPVVTTTFFQFSRTDLSDVECLSQNAENIPNPEQEFGQGCDVSGATAELTTLSCL